MQNHNPNRCLIDEIMWHCCSVFVILMGFWTLLANSVCFTGGSFIDLCHIAPLVPILTVITVGLLNRCRAADNTKVPSANFFVWEISPNTTQYAGIVCAIIVIAIYYILANYIFFWAASCLILGFFYISHLNAPMISIQRATKIHKEAFVVFCLAIACVAFTLVAHRSDADDSGYLGLAVNAIAAPAIPLFEIAKQRYQSIELLYALFAVLFDCEPIIIAHLVLPPLFAFLCVYAGARLIRLLIGDYWLWGTMALVIVLVVGRETHWAFGNFAFVRLFQGKSVFVTLLIPLIIIYCLEFVVSPTLGSWVKLSFAQIAAVGLTRNALPMAPLAAFFALMGCWLPSWKMTQRIGYGILSSLYPLICVTAMTVVQNPSLVAGNNYLKYAGTKEGLIAAAGAILSLVIIFLWAQRRKTLNVKRWVPWSVLVGAIFSLSFFLRFYILETSVSTILHRYKQFKSFVNADSVQLIEKTFNQVFGVNELKFLWIMALLFSWSVLRDPARRRLLLGASLAFLVLFMNPLLVDFWISYIIYPQIYFRIFWMLPLPVWMAVLLTAPLYFRRTDKSFKIRFTAFLFLLCLFVFWGTQNFTTFAHDHIEFNKPRLKVPYPDYSVARYLSKHAEHGETILAPRNISLWLSTFRKKPQIAFTRKNVRMPAKKRLLMESLEKPKGPNGVKYWLDDIHKGWSILTDLTNINIVVANKNLESLGNIWTTLKKSGFSCRVSDAFPDYYFFCRGHWTAQFLQDCFLEDANGFRKRILEYGQQYLTISPQHGITGIKPTHQLEVKSCKNGILLHATGSDPNLILPSCELPNTGSRILMIDITPPEITTLKIYYKNHFQTEYSEKRSIKSILIEGRNRFYLDLGQLKFKGPLRLDPGGAPGNYILHRIELIMVHPDFALVKRFSDATEVCLKVNGNKNDEKIMPLHDLSVFPASNGLILHATGKDPFFLLPHFDNRNNKELLINIEITSPAQTVMQVFFTSQTSPTFNEKNSVRIHLVRGHNRVLFPLPQSDISGRLRLDPGAAPGDYILHSLEVRATD